MVEAERRPSPETESATYTEHLALQVRLSLGTVDALNPENKSLYDIKEEDFTAIPFEVLTNASHADRKTYWEKQGIADPAEQRRTWEKGMISAFNSKQEFFRTKEGQKWVSLYTSLGINATSFTEKEATKLYESYFTGVKKDSNLQRFSHNVSQYFSSSSYDDVKSQLDSIQWIANIFGKDHAAEIITNVIDVNHKKNDITESAKLIQQVNEVNSSGVSLINNVDADQRGKELLKFLWENSEITTPPQVIQPSPVDKDGARINEKTLIERSRVLKSENPIEEIKETLDISGEKEESFQLSLEQLQHFLTSDIHPEFPNTIKFSDLDLKLEGNHLRVKGKFQLAESGTFNSDAITTPDHQFRFINYNYSMPGEGRGGGPFEGMNELVTNYINQITNPSWDIKKISFENEKIVLGFEKNEHNHKPEKESDKVGAAKGVSKDENTKFTELSIEATEELVSVMQGEMHNVTAEAIKKINEVTAAALAGHISDEEFRAKLKEINDQSMLKHNEISRKIMQNARNLSNLRAQPKKEDKTYQEKNESIINNEAVTKKSGELVKTFLDNNPHLLFDKTLFHQEVAQPPASAGR